MQYVSYETDRSWCQSLITASTMPCCTRRGCGKDYDPGQNDNASCSYHPGAPVFHEGLKSWSCCSAVNKPVLDFDEFMNISGCTVGAHSDEKPDVTSQTHKVPTLGHLTMTKSSQGLEVYSTSTVKSAAGSAATVVTATQIDPPVEEEDDLRASVIPGTICRRRGCGVAFVSDQENRVGDGTGSVCTYHPAPPIFREGSKGYLCCKRRVLEFDEFLKIEGCTKGRHIFAPKQARQELTEQFTDCRIDHYQTPNEVHVSVFAKQADRDKSSVTVEEMQVHLDLFLPGQKRFKRTLNLFGPVLPQESSYQFYGTKVEVLLKKLDGRSWTLLEKTTRSIGNISLTFGVGGRTGTIGGKEVVLDEQNAVNRRA
ncbi:chord-domain-containing protein [Pisolithus croceorrhizus]|nr:chord-domain-containing protein [Pisolithus croceorrhizus]